MTRNWSNTMAVGKQLHQRFQEVLDGIVKLDTEEKYINMRQDLNGEELSIGDRILVCTEKRYGWLDYAKIVGESNLTWRIEIEDTNTYNRKRNFEKNSKRILKVA